MTLDELRDEFDWMFEFQSRMAERIRGDADVHHLVDYVGKLESENAKLRKCCVYYDRDNNTCGYYDPISHRLGAENAKLRELCADMFKLAGEVYVPLEDAGDWMARDGDIDCRMRELGIEVDE